MIYDWDREQDFLEDQPNPQSLPNGIQIEDLAGPDLKETFGGALLIIGLGNIVLAAIGSEPANLHQSLGNIGGRAALAVPSIITAYGGYNWLKGRAYLNGLFD